MQLPSSLHRCLQSDPMRCETALAEEMYSTGNVASCSTHLQSLLGCVTSSNVTSVTNLLHWGNGWTVVCNHAGQHGHLGDGSQVYFQINLSIHYPCYRPNFMWVPAPICCQWWHWNIGIWTLSRPRFSWTLTTSSKFAANRGVRGWREDLLFCLCT